MCGIAGFCGAGDRHDIEAMVAALRHRGPDGEATWQEPPVFLGHTRLAILDIPGGAQPMWTEDGRYGIVFNGEIYNHQTLRQQLIQQGHRFHSGHSDTETLLLGYREWGASLCERLNGMWAFAIYDRIKGEIFLSRDRFGQKPLYYYRGQEGFAFASEITALAAHRHIHLTVDGAGLRKFFGYGFIPAPRSLYRNIYKLPGGCSMTFQINSGTSQIHRYWQFQLEPDEPWSPSAEARWCEQFRELLDRAVERRLMADVPIGIFLSGGIDSSSVAAFASQHQPIQTFAVGFEEASFDESQQAAFAAQHVGAQHHSQTLSWQQGRALMNDVVTKLDEPMGDVSILPCHLLGRFTAQKVKVALGGDGADELLAGYDPFHALRWANRYAKLVPKPMHRAIGLLMSRLPVSHRNMSLDFKIKRTLGGLNHSPPLWCPTWMAPISPTELAELLAEPVDAEDLYAEAIDVWERLPQGSLVDRTLMYFTQLYLQDDILVKIDRANMWHGLEARSPFLDIDLVNFLRHLPQDVKYRRGTSKYLLKQAMAPLLPAEIRQRKKKGFGVPIGAWFRDQDDLHTDSGDSLGLSQSVIDKMRNVHRQGRRDERLFLWCHWLLQNHLKHGPACGKHR